MKKIYTVVRNGKAVAEAPNRRKAMCKARRIQRNDDGCRTVAVHVEVIQAVRTTLPRGKFKIFRNTGLVRSYSGRAA